MKHDRDIGQIKNDTFETGRPVEFNYIRNTVPSIDMGERFQQHIEPAGRYMVYHTSDGELDPSWESGIAKFDNPLVITFHSTPGEFRYDEMSWKMRLHRAYGGLTGKGLTKAILADGYDGIVTIRTDENGNPTEVSEIVDLRPFKKANKEWSFKYSQQKIAKALPINQITDHLHQTIVNYIDGDWELLRVAKLMPSYKLQKYGVIEMIGRNVKIDGDAYYVKVFYEVRKRRGEIDYPPGYFADDNPPGGKWIGPADSQQRTEVEKKWQYPYENAETYDSELGHQLLSFRGFIEGWKGPNAPHHEAEERIFPIGENDPRHSMVRIGTFGSTVEERQMQERNPADTPFAVAETIRNSIDRFWEFGGEGDNDKNNPTKPDLPYEGIKSPVMSPVTAQKFSQNWDGIEWPVRQGTGDDVNEMDSPPEMTGSDYVLYHGTSLPVAQKIVNERRLTADDWGSVGVCTTPRGASVYGSMKARRIPDGTRIQSAVVRLVVDGNWFRQQQLTREVGGSGHDQWLIRGSPAEIPSEALKDIRIWTISGERVEAWSYNYIKTSWKHWFKESQVTVTLDDASFNAYIEKVREYWISLADWSMNKDTDQSKFTYEMAEEATQETVNQTKVNMTNILQNIQNMVNSIPWNGSVVLIKVGSPGFGFMNKPEWGNPVTNAEIVIGQGQMAPSFSYFYDDESGKFDIDDILDAGDDDFFQSPQEESDYFNLVRYLKNPAAMQSQKVITVYTARPSRDRQMYLDAQSIPSNIFVTNDYNHAEGLSRDLPGGARDIWKIRVEEKYLMPTLEMGRLREYQVIGSGMVPIRSIVLLDAGA